MPELSKDDLLSNLYYDSDKGYGSAQSLYKQAQEEDINISLEYVNNCIKQKQPNKQRKGYKGYDSYTRSVRVPTRISLRVPTCLTGFPFHMSASQVSV